MSTYHANQHGELIDTTEMYLRTIFELEEEGVAPLRARIAERLKQSGPTVSQTVARMERDGLLHLDPDRHLLLTELGQRRATAVMRKHRLAECLLLDVLGLDWDQLHVEACRWEHVMSDAVERRILSLLHEPHVCPHGNPIPGLDDLQPADHTDAAEPSDSDGVTTLASSATATSGQVKVRRISEYLQPDEALMRMLCSSGLTPGSTVTIERTSEGIEVHGGDMATVVNEPVAEGIFVSRQG